MSEKRRLATKMVDDDDDDDSGIVRVTPAGSEVTVRILPSQSVPRFLVKCEETGGWWVLDKEELERATELISPQPE